MVPEVLCLDWESCFKSCHLRSSIIELGRRKAVGDLNTMTLRQKGISVFGLFALIHAGSAYGGVNVSATTNSAALQAALHTQGLTVTSVRPANGWLEQFGTYT